MATSVRPIWLILLIILVLIVDAIATVKHLYFYYWWLDTPMHLLVGMALGLIIQQLFNVSPFFHRFVDSVPKKLLFSATFVLFIAIFWEVYEYFFDRMTVHSVYYFLDTIKDVLVGLVGGIFSSLISLKRGYNNTDV